jgi:hypothetical protein
VCGVRARARFCCVCAFLCVCARADGNGAVFVVFGLL